MLNTSRFSASIFFSVLDKTFCLTRNGDESKLKIVFLPCRVFNPTTYTQSDQQSNKSHYVKFAILGPSSTESHTKPILALLGVALANVDLPNNKQKQNMVTSVRIHIAIHSYIQRNRADSSVLKLAVQLELQRQLQL